MNKNESNDRRPSTPEERIAAGLDLIRALPTSCWAPNRRAMIPVALPERFVEGIAWDEV